MVCVSVPQCHRFDPLALFKSLNNGYLSTTATLFVRRVLIVKRVFCINKFSGVFQESVHSSVHMKGVVVPLPRPTYVKSTCEHILVNDHISVKPLDVDEHLPALQTLRTIPVYTLVCIVQLIRCFLFLT